MTASVVDAVRCAVEVQRAMVDRNAALPEDQRMSFRIGVNLGDIVNDGEDEFQGYFVRRNGTGSCAPRAAIPTPASQCTNLTDWSGFGYPGTGAFEGGPIL